MGMPASTMSTDQVAAPRARGLLGATGSHRLFGGLKSDLYGDADFDGRMATLHAGDVVLTRLEANRHRVMRSPSLARASDAGYLKIVAPYVGCAGVEQKGREAWVTPDQWSIYDTTDSYAVANPVRVEHLIVMLPKDQLVERGLALDPLMARRLGGSGGVARLALETMRIGLPRAAGHVGSRGARRRRRDHAVRAPVDARPGRHRHRDDAARGAARAHQAARGRAPGRPGAVGRQHRARAQLQPAPPVQRLRRRARRRGRLHPAAAGSRPAASASTTAPTTTARSPTSRSASASRTWRTSAACSAPTWACAPSDYRRAAGGLAG